MTFNEATHRTLCVLVSLAFAAGLWTEGVFMTVFIVALRALTLIDGDKAPYE